MATIQNIIRGLQIIGSYDDYILGWSDWAQLPEAYYIEAGPDCRVSMSCAEQGGTTIIVPFLHKNEENILRSNGWFVDEHSGRWTIQTDV